MSGNETMPLLHHLAELRRRLLWCLAALVAASCAAYGFAPQIYAFLMHPLAEVLQGEDRRMIYTGLTEAFMTYIKLSFFAGAFAVMPFFLYQLWLFIAPGLYRNEKKALLPFLAATPVLFLAGAGFVYYVVIPMAWKFFVGFETPDGAGGGLPIRLEARVGEYLSLITSLMFSFGLCFQLPVLLTLLGRTGILRADTLAQKRRYAVVAILVVAALMTPPDVISQLTLALPLMGLYEISILLMRLSEKRRGVVRV